jgi:hypothetical protein
MDEDMFERLVANQELDGLLDDPEWVPTDSEMRKFRAFNASLDLLAQARRRIERAEGDLEDFV